MKRLLMVTIAIIALLQGVGTTWAGPFEDGLAADERGDYAKALKIYRSLARQGDAAAQVNLGVMYRIGRGVAQDYAEAVKWFRLAAAQGDAGAKDNLGGMYQYGQGVAQDYAEAVKWYQLAAAQGNSGARLNLGVMYEDGKGVAQDYVRAHMWYNLDAASGDATAATYRDLVEKRMTPQQIGKAQKMASSCQRRHFKGCD